MRKLLLSAFFMYLSFSALCQWTIQGLNYQLPDLGTGTISIVNENVVWTAVRVNAVESRYSRTNNGGLTWNPGIIQSYTGNIEKIIALSYDTAWALIYPLIQPPYSNLLKTVDGGQTWQESMLGTTSQSLLNFHFWDSNNGFLITSRQNNYYSFYTSSDGGITWTKVDSANIPLPDTISMEDIYGNSMSVVGQTIFIATSAGRVFKSYNMGHNWNVYLTPYFSPINWDLYQVFFKDVNHGIIKKFQNNSSFYETFNGGNTWSSLVNPVGPVYRYDFCWVPGTSNTCISVGKDNGFSGCSYSFDGGHTWADFDTLLGIQLLQTKWVNNTTGWASGYTVLPEPTSTGIYKYSGNLVSILQTDSNTVSVNFIPNPSNGNVIISIDGYKSDVVFEIYNLLGQRVYLDAFQLNSNHSKIKKDLTFLMSGIYEASIKSGSKRITQKILINK